MPQGNPRRANGHRRNQLRDWLKAQHRPCWICRAFGKSGTIDYTLPAGHPYSFEVDELIPVSRGGSPLKSSNVDAAHRCCNQWRGNKSVEQVMAMGRQARIPSSIPVGRARPKPTRAPSVRGVTSHLSD